MVGAASGKLNTLANDEVAVSAGAAAFTVSLQSQGWRPPIWNSKIGSWVAHSAQPGASPTHRP
jgi:hypothetical protein